jgi:peptidoglycan/LPS O-acetylase OafA/YrhL
MQTVGDIRTHVGHHFRHGDRFRSSINGCAVIFGFVVWLFANEAGPVSKFLMTHPFVNLGRWPYSIYLFHWFVVSFVSRIDKIMQVVMAKQSEMRRKRLGYMGYWS